MHVYAGTAGHSAWFSDDVGETWVHPNSHSGMYLEARVWSLASHPATPERLFAGTDMGVFRWDEPTARWAHLPSPMQDVWAVAVDPADPDMLIAGTRPAGFWRSTDAGETWTPLTAPGVLPALRRERGPTRVTQILFDPVDDGTVWAAVEIGSIYRSRDRGATWERKEKGLVSGDVHGLAVLKLPGGGKAVLATTNRGLHRSEDDGETWALQELPSPWPYTRSRGAARRQLGRACSSPTATARPATTASCCARATTDGPGRMPSCRARSRARSGASPPTPADPMLIFVCTNLGELFRSTDGGESWTRLPHVFGELRALHWRALPAGTRRAAHSVTRPVLKAAQLGWVAA